MGDLGDTIPEQGPALMRNRLNIQFVWLFRGGLRGVGAKRISEVLSMG
jgi:hypothetical protein